MKVSRAGFLKICGAVLLGRTADASSLFTSGGGAVAAAATGPPRAPFRVGDASAALFQPHLNTRFAVRSAEGTAVPVVLAQIIEGPLTRDVEQFALRFHAPPGVPLPHGTHAFQHPALGAFDLFIAPIGGASTERTVYEACFSRHVSAREITVRARREPAARGPRRAFGARWGVRGGDTACQTHS